MNKSRVRSWCLFYSAIHVAVFGLIFLSGIQFGPSTELVLYLLFTLGPTIYFVEIYARFFLSSVSPLSAKTRDYCKRC